MSDIPRGAIRFNTDSNKPELWDGSQWAEFQLSTPNLGTNLLSTGSVYFNGSAYLTVPSSTDFGLVEQDWTVECYAYIEQKVGSYGRLWYLEGDSASDLDGVYFSNTHLSMGSTNTWSIGDGTNGEYERNQWVHVAVVHDSTNMRMYIDGVQAHTTSNNFRNNSSKKLTLMSTNNVNHTGTGKGWISNFRIIKGTALYTSNFTPPAAPLTNVTNTKILCCQSGTSATAAAVSPGSLTSSSATASTFGPFNSDAQPGPRGLFGGGQNPGGEIKNIDFINLSSGGRALNFGDLQQTRQALCSFGSPTRGFWAGGRDAPTNYDIVEFVTFSTTGNFTDFGDDLESVKQGPFGCSNSTRGIVGGGFTKTTIDYVTMASTGKVSTFGTLSSGMSGVYQTGIMTPTRGVFNRSLGGSPLVGTKEISSVTIATTGNAVEFGDLSLGRASPGASSNPVRGIFFGGYSPDTSSMEYFNMASGGTGADFGNLSQNTKYNVGNCATPTRGFCAGGSPYTTNIQYIDLISLGDAVKFGDLSSAARYKAGISNAHGGL